MKIKVHLTGEESSTLDIEDAHNWSVGTIGELYIHKRALRDGTGYGSYYSNVFAPGEWKRVDTVEYL